MTETLVIIIQAALTALARSAPEVAKAFTGGQSVDDAIQAAHEAASSLPVRTGPGGTWEDDLERRK